MTVNKMIDLYITYGLDERTWDMLREMTCHGLIKQDTWKKFYEKCKGWAFSESGNEIIDSETEKVVYYYDDIGNPVKA